MIRNKKRKIGLIGNTISVDLITILLKKDYHITRFFSSNRYQNLTPFYPNDLSIGIMKRFIEDSGLNDIVHEKLIKNIRIFINYRWIEFEASLDGLQNYLISMYKEESENIKSFFKTLRSIGKEWEDFLEVRFNDKNVSFRNSAKYMVPLQKAFDIFMIKDVEVRNILSLFIPVEDVTFSVYSGYIYTQFFDMNAINIDIWDLIKKVSYEMSNEIVALDNIDDIEVVEFTAGELSEESREDYDIVIDFRPLNKEGKYYNEKLNTIRGTLGSNIPVLNKDNFYLLNISNSINIRLWNEISFNTNKSNGNWEFELTSSDYNDEKVLSIFKKWLEKLLGTSFDIFGNSIKTKEYFQQEFEVINGSGYCWAFNSKQSYNDPTNLLKKHRDHYLNSSYWGFAWFSAAYHAVSVIKNHMELTEGGSMSIIRKRRNESE